MAAAVGKLGAACLIAVSLAQSQTFEVASVKPSSPTEQWGYRFAPGGRTILTGFRVRDMIMLAWHIQDFRLIGANGWMESEHYSIEARAAGNPTEDESRLMLRALLADRFQQTPSRNSTSC